MAAAYNIYGTTIPSLTLLVKLQSRLTRCRELLTNQACCKRGLSLVVRAVHQMRQKASIFFPFQELSFWIPTKASDTGGHKLCCLCLGSKLTCHSSGEEWRLERPVTY